MERVKVGVKLCGNCNPYVDGPVVIEAVKLIADNIEFVRWDCAEKDLLLVICGCPVGCVSMPAFDGPVVNVVCNALNGRQWPEGELPGEIVRTILYLLHGRKSAQEKDLF